MKRTPLSWSVGYAARADEVPARFVAATVPGAVQLDWARAEGWPEYWKGKECERYRWMEDVHWTYVADLPAINLGRGERAFLVCGGVDYAFRVCWNGEVVHTQEGMFTPFEVDLSDRVAGGGRIEVRLLPAPKAPSDTEDRTQARACVKPAVSYGWDWHPRLIPLGIWEETYLEIRPASHLRDAELRYTLDEALTQAAIDVHATATEADGRTVRWTLLSPEGDAVETMSAQCRAGSVSFRATLAGPRLWWTHDQGEQPLYVSRVEILNADGTAADAREQRVGFRRVRLVMHEGAWRHPSVFPKSRSHPPITVELNGRVIFMRGSNWVPPSIFPGTITAETYRPLLKLAREAHFNLLRCWGGGIVGKEPFFEQCDALGLLVWQEFPLSCNLYDETARYLAVLDQESRSIIRRLRRHACLGLWCGGNELFNVWSGMTDQSRALRLLNANTLELDPGTPFIPTAPIDGMAHGDYRFRDENGREVYQIYAGARHTAYTEFGCPGPSPVEYLKTFIPEAELWPPRAGTAWQTHHGLGAWDVDPTSWLSSATLQHYFGEAKDLPTLIGRGEWLQSEGYKCIFEEARRQKPVSAMALNWCFNEPWPAAANNSIVNWPAAPKAGYNAVKAACRPVLLSARIPKFSWTAGEEFRAEIWLLNDLHREFDVGAVEVTLVLGSEERVLLNWMAPSLAPNRHCAGPEVRHVLRASPGVDRLVLRVSCAAHPEWSSEYVLPFRSDVISTGDREPGKRLKPRALNT